MSKEREMVVACRFGLMGLSMKGIGRKAKFTERADLYMQMVTSKKEIGLKIKRTDGVNILTLMVLNTKENGLRTNSMAKEKRFGQMELCLMVFIIRERRMEKERLSGPIILNMKGSSKII